MSIKIREAEGEMPFWVEEAIRDEGLQQETEPGAPISQGETEEGRKKKTSQCEEGNSSTRKGETTKKKREAKKVCFQLNEPNGTPEPAPLNGVGTIQETPNMNGNCYKYEILRESYMALKHSYIHLRKRYEMAEKSMERAATARRQKGQEELESEKEGGKTKKRRKVEKEGGEEEKEGENENWMMVFMKV